MVVITAGSHFIVIAVAALVAVTGDFFQRFAFLRNFRSFMFLPYWSQPNAVRRIDACHKYASTCCVLKPFRFSLERRLDKRKPDPPPNPAAIPANWLARSFLHYFFRCFTLVPGFGSSNPRPAGEGLSFGANPGVRNKQNFGSDAAVAPLLQSMSQLTAMFAAQSASNNTAVSTLSSQLEADSSAFERPLAANSVVLLVINDRINFLEQKLKTSFDPSNRDHRQSASAPLRPPSPTDPALQPPCPREQSESSGHTTDQTCITKAQQSPT